MREVEEKPKSGQFVSMSVFDGEIWARTYKWWGGDLMEYNPDNESWGDASKDAPGIIYKYFVNT